MAILGYETFAAAKARFTWADRWRLFDGGPDRFNLAHECLLRHVAAGRGKSPAARIVMPDGGIECAGFADLASDALRMAAHLRDRGIGAGDAVVMHLDPSLDYLRLLMGGLAAGAVMVPCSRLLGADAMALRIADARPRLVVGEPGDAPMALPADTAFTACGALVRDASRESAAFVPETRASDPAFYVYSSGTTGRPKRTVIQQQGFTYLVAIVGALVLDLGPADRYLATYAPNWLAGFGWGALVPMALGTAAGMLRGRFDADRVMDALERMEATALHAPPTAYRRLLGADRGQLIPLAKLAYTAEAMDAGLAEAIRSRFGHYARGHYGASEVGMVAADYAFPDYAVHPGAVGKPLPGTDVVIVDAADGPVVPGAVGAVALRRGGHVLRTGDLGWVDEDGYLRLKGRENDAIISAGYTIGAEEIEEALRLHPWVADAAVVARPDAERGHVPRAFVQLRPGGASGVDEYALAAALKDHVRARLGRHAYPHDVIVMAELPRNENGKVAKATLRAAQD